MKKTFADALSELLAEYADDDANDIISELEMQLYALRETSTNEEN